MRLLPLLSLCSIAFSEEVFVQNYASSLRGQIRSLGKLEDLEALHEKQLAEAKELFDRFNAEKNAEKAKDIKKKLDSAEAAARKTQRQIRDVKRSNDSAASGDKSDLKLKDQVKSRADDRDAENNTDALDLANEDLRTGGKTAGDKAKKAVDGTVAGAKKAGTKVKSEVKDAGEAMADEAVKAGDKVKAGAVAVGNAAVNASLGVKNAVKHAGTNSQIAAQNAGDAIGDKTAEIKDNMVGGIKQVGASIKKGGENMVKGIKTAGDAMHVAAVNTGDFIGDSATNIREGMVSGLAGGFGALGHSISHFGSYMEDVTLRRRDLGLKWWKALLAVLGSSVAVALFASIWELTGLGKKNSLDIDDLEPHFVNPPPAATADTAAAGATVAAVTTKTDEAPVVDVAVAPTEPTIIEQAVPADVEDAKAGAPVVATKIDTQVVAPPADVQVGAPKGDSPKVVTTVTTEPAVGGTTISSLKDKFDHGD